MKRRSGLIADWNNLLDLASSEACMPATLAFPKKGKNPQHVKCRQQMIRLIQRSPLLGEGGKMEKAMIDFQKKYKKQ